MAEIFAAFPLRFIDGLRATFGFLENVGGKGMREMMLADDDLGVNAEFSGTSKNFDDAARRRCASLGIAQQLHIHNRAVQFIQPRNAPRSNAGFIPTAEAQLLPQSRRQFVATRNLHFVLDPDIVRQHNIVLRAVAKQTNHRRMCTAEDSNDSPFSPLRTADAAQSLNLCQNLVAMHGVLYRVARNEHIAVEVRHRRFRHHKAVAIVVKNQASLHLIAIRHRRSFKTLGRVRRWSLSRPCSVRPPAWKTVPSPRQFLDGPALFQFGEHFVERTIVALF